jgi:hypothetical protein
VLKNAINLVKEGAEEVSKLCTLKKEAVDKEDYDTAETYKACLYGELKKKEDLHNSLTAFTILIERY